MKKLIAVFAVLLLAAPAMAADWSFYGSQRMATFYVSDDYGDFNVNGEDDDWGLQWNFQTNSRVGAKVKADKVRGHIELGLKGTDASDIDVGTRRAYGVWDFADGMYLKVGKDYTAINNRFMSGQVFGEDAGLLGAGQFYPRRPGQIGIGIGGFEIDFITNAANGSGYSAVGGSYPAIPGVGAAGADIDWNLPKVEAAWLLKFGSFDIRPYGGVQYFKVASTSVSEASGALTDDVDVWSWVVGLDSMINIGAFYIGVQGSYGMNWTNANWSNSLLGGTAGSLAILDGGDDVKNTTSWMAMVAMGLKVTPTLSFEVGGGFRSDDPDVSGADADEMWSIYGQAVITLAPGVYIIPEAGYIDRMDNFAGDDEGYQWYVGAKWQIDF